MEIKRIIVDELPDCCLDCDYIGSMLFSNKDYCESAHKEIMSDIEIERSPLCPLDVEKECIWLGEYYGYDENGDMIFVSKKTGCSDVHIQAVKVPDNTFCPNCGKRIRYEEE
jgi:hypothetical protein